jgi:hypothetical protein
VSPIPRQHQVALNRFTPPTGKLPMRPNPFPVRVRIEWSGDGEQWQNGDAIAWNASHVHVRLSDPEVYGVYVWLHPQDVQRA